MKARSTASKVLLVLLATVMLVLSGTIAWAAVNDYQSRGYIPKGVTIAGHDVSGMTEQQARAVIDQAVSTPLSRPITLTADRKTFTLDPKGVITVDADTMIAQAYAPRENATFIERVKHNLGGAELPAQVAAKYSINQAAIDAWVAKTGASIKRPATDAVRTISGYKVEVKPATYGVQLNQAAASKQIAAALLSDTALADASKNASLPTSLVKPKVVQSSFKNVLIVSLSDCKIYLWNGNKLVKTYSCAPGQAAYPTPKGDFKINAKLKNSPWINPGTDWAKSMPAEIAPGPDNPMGVTKIGINYPGVFMHGVPPGEFDSIGTHASHGCMRMMPSAVADLFKRVNIGDPVYIKD